MKLANPGKKLTQKESVAVLREILTKGRENAQQVQGTEVICVIGNTGAGKSTMVNFLCGAEMEEVRRKDIGIKAPGKVQSFGRWPFIHR